MCYWGRCLFKASSVHNQIYSPCCFVHGFRAAGIGWCFLFGDLQKPGPVSHSGVLHSQLGITGAILTPFSSGRHSQKWSSQHDSACRLLERFALHPAAPGLLLSLSLPSFPLLFKKMVSLQVWVETSLRAFFILFNSINPSSVLFLLHFINACNCKCYTLVLFPASV